MTISSGTKEDDNQNSFLDPRSAPHSRLHKTDIETLLSPSISLNVTPPASIDIDPLSVQETGDPKDFTPLTTHSGSTVSL